MAQTKPRWLYRFDNLTRALILLREAVQLQAEQELSDLEQEGLVQRFEYCWELAWKTMKDYLEHHGVVLVAVTPRHVIKEAIAMRLITQGESWMNALDAHNKLSHIYSQNVFSDVTKDIEATYLGLFEALYETLLDAINQD